MSLATVLICDNCQKELRVETFGIHRAQEAAKEHGWLIYNKDWCSQECLKQWLAKDSAGGVLADRDRP